jgi:hypothetical protein
MERPVERRTAPEEIRASRIGSRLSTVQRVRAVASSYSRAVLSRASSATTVPPGSTSTSLNAPGAPV